MIWIDKLAVAWALTLWVIFGQLGRADMTASILPFWEFKAILLLAGGPWLILRATHLGWLMMLRPR